MVSFAAKAFMGFMALADAINRAGSTDPDRIRRAILATNISAEQSIVTWGTKFDPKTGQNILASTMLQQIQAVSGTYQYMTVWPWDVAAREIIYPIPDWSKRA
jgi:branched-chain amino acid transport system substrate-binding protein